MLVIGANQFNRTANYRQFKFRLPHGHPEPLMHLRALPTFATKSQSTRDATAAHQDPREHQPTRPRGQPQCTRSSSSSLPPEPL